MQHPFSRPVVSPAKRGGKYGRARKDSTGPLCQPAVLLDEFLSFFDADEALPLPLIELLKQLFGVVDMLHGDAAFKRVRPRFKPARLETVP
ncbi:MAG: hypothetical protein E5V18_00220 [Mesorhizobium sp.]|nr:MAG: hypothetical protein E5V18_00220 [Mesorhizobium sp.]